MQALTLAQLRETEGAVPSAPVSISCSGFKKLSYKSFGIANGRLGALPFGKAGGDGRRERAARSVAIRSVEPSGYEQCRRLRLPVEPSVRRGVAAAMPTFQKHAATPDTFGNDGGSLYRRLRQAPVISGEKTRGLGEIRRQHVGKGIERASDIFRHGSVAALGR